MATNAYWREFGTLLLAAILGGLAIMPYSLRLIKTSNKPTGLPLSTILLLSIIQNTILSAIAIGIGLVAAHSIGLGAPCITAMVTGGQVQNLTSMLLLAIGLGLVGGFFLMLLDILFVPYWPKPILELALSASLWENFTASFYGSVNEELLTRLFGVSVTAWLLGRIWHTTAGVPTSAVFWAAIALLAVLFAVGHLPTLKGLVNEVSPTMLSRTIILNTPIGLTCGWLFWRYGIEAAMLTHFTADIVYHVGGTIVIQRIKLPKLAV